MKTNRFFFVAPLQSKEDVVECAVILLANDYEQRYPSLDQQDHLFIDTESKEFWFLDEVGMNHTIECAKIPENEVIETNLIELSQWQSNQKAQA